MAAQPTKSGLRALLNRAMPLFARMMLGDVVYDLINKHNALLAKLDSNHGAATDHVATLRVKLPEER